MTGGSRFYVIAVQAPAYALSPSRFATESAFAEHRRELRRSLKRDVDRVILVAPRLARDQFESVRAHLSVVDAGTDGVEFVPAHEARSGPVDFWMKSAVPIVRALWRIAPQSAVFHAGLADDIHRPLMAIVCLVGWVRRVPVVFIVDIDFREYARRFDELGIWSRSSYWVNRLFYDPLKWVQIWWAVRAYQLVLLKSPALVRDFGKGRAHVRSFFDTVHASSDVITDSEVDARVQQVRRARSEELRVVYFGRFVRYKGLDRAIEAVAVARAAGTDVRLTLIGAGESDNDLRVLTTSLGLGDAVDFREPIPYGPKLFESLARFDVSIATPLVEDTPRATFDSLARGLPLIAFDLLYFVELASASGALYLATWPRVDSLAEQFRVVAENRDDLARRVVAGVHFARQHDQQAWLAKRAAWTRAIMREV